MSFAIIISEKGGAERRELFEKSEVHVGRVQGNDLMLPKGNVSKRHAKLAFRDGRFVVTDLRSTNGTYVNGRKITQATFVREGDKIYVGDFVLRFEAPPGVALAPESSPQAGGETPAHPRTSAPPPPPDFAASPHPASREASVVSHFPLEHDPDDAGSSGPSAGVSPNPRAPQVPSPPRMPGALAVARGGTQQLATSTPEIPVAPRPAPRATGEARPARVDQPRTPSSREGATAAHRLALVTLVERVSETIDLEVLLDGTAPDDALAQRVERALREDAGALRSDGEIPDHLVLDALVRDAQRELLGLGPIGPLLDDDEVSELYVTRHDHLVALRGGQKTAIEPGFSSEDSLRRVLARLCRHGGVPLGQELVIERRLPHGVRLSAVLPPISQQGLVMVLRKRRRVDATLDELVRGGVMSRGIATFLGACVTARANVLIAGPGGSGATQLVAALAALAAPDDRVAAVHEPDETLVSGAGVAAFALGDVGDPATVVRAAARVGADRLVVRLASPDVSTAALDTIAEGARGVLALLDAPTLRQGLARLGVGLCSGRPGLDPEAAREWVAASFDVAIEVARLRDGRSRVLRVIDLAAGDASQGPREVFTFTVERTAAGGAIEGAFQASGYVPRVVDDMRARGTQVDPSLFGATSRPTP